MKIQNNFLKLLIPVLALGLAAFTTNLAAGPLKVKTASPNSGVQGETHTVKITGVGFTQAINVRFLVSKSTDDTGKVEAGKPKVLDDETLTTTVVIPDGATVADYDIEVQLRNGRRGKGTTLFSVRAKHKQEVYSCSDVTSGPSESCTCKFSWNGLDNIYGLLEDCVTSETLKLTAMIRTDGSIQANGTERLTLTAVPCNKNIQNCTKVGENKFLGSSVIANNYHRARVRYLDIVIGQGIEAGCEPGELHSAISFVLDADTPDPTDSLPQDAPDPVNRNSLFFVADIGVYSEHDPLCNGVEVIRTQAYTDMYTIEPDPLKDPIGLPARDWKISVSNTEISLGSYIKSGITMLGMMPMQSINPPSVVNNTIWAAACEEGTPEYVAKAIHFGELTHDPDNQIDGVVEGNTIDMADSCDRSISYTAGVLVGGDVSGIQTVVKVSKNDISGALIGVEVDCDVAEAGFSGNTLTGDLGQETIGIFSEARSTIWKGKPNVWESYLSENEKIEGRSGCLGQP